MQRKLHHLEQIWVKRPVFFVTVVSQGRQPFLDNSEAHIVLQKEWKDALHRHGWAIGEYVIMPDHVHFFARPATENSVELPTFIKKWKEWTAKKLQQAGIIQPGSFWQADFFDRLMRTEQEWEDKRLYMLDNPVRAGFVASPDMWPYKGDLDMFRL